MNTQIRPATEADIPAINAIYNHFVLHCTCTYQTEPETDEARRAWLTGRAGEHPVMVAERDGKVVAWGSLSPFHRRQAYARTVENSIYVHPEEQGRGLGRLMLEDQISRAAAAGHHVIVAVISADQEASIGLHTKLGFTEAGRLHEVGKKFGRWLDVVYMQRKL